MANTSITGNVTRELDLRSTKNDVPFVRGSVAVNRKVGENESVSYIDFVAYRSLAENVVKSVSKGDRIIVTGRLETYTIEMETNEGTKNVTKTQVVADSVGPDLRWATAEITRNPKSGGGDSGAEEAF